MLWCPKRIGLGPPLYPHRDEDKLVQSSAHRRPLTPKHRRTAHSGLSSLRRRRRNLPARRSENPESEPLSRECRVLWRTRQLLVVSEADRCFSSAHASAAAVGHILLADRFDSSAADRNVPSGGGLLPARVCAMGSRYVDGHSADPADRGDRSLHPRSVSESSEPGGIHGRVCYGGGIG